MKYVPIKIVVWLFQSGSTNFCEYVCLAGQAGLCHVIHNLMRNCSCPNIPAKFFIEVSHIFLVALCLLQLNLPMRHRKIRSTESYKMPFLKISREKNITCARKLSIYTQSTQFSIAN